LGSDDGQPGSVTRSPAVPLVDRLTAGRPSAGSKPTESGPLTETAAPTVTIKLPESYKDIADAVICSEHTTTNTEVTNTHAPTSSNNTTVKNAHTLINTEVRSTHAPSTPTPQPTVTSLFTILSPIEGFTGFM